MDRFTIQPGDIEFVDLGSAEAVTQSVDPRPNPYAPSQPHPRQPTHEPKTFRSTPSGSDALLHSSRNSSSSRPTVMS